MNSDIENKHYYLKRAFSLKMEKQTKLTWTDTQHAIIKKHRSFRTALNS